MFPTRLRMVDEYAMIKERVSVPVAQWIERRSPEPDAQVQFLSGTPHEPASRAGLLFCPRKLISVDSNADSNPYYWPESRVLSRLTAFSCNDGKTCE